MKIKFPKFDCRREYIFALTETLLIVPLTTLPTLIGILTMLIEKNSITILDLYKSGEFFLYSVSFLGSSLLVYRHLRGNKIHWNDLFTIIILILIIIFSLVYAIVLKSSNPDLGVIKVLSFISILFSIPIFYASQVIVNKNKSIDVREKRHDEQETIENALN